MIENAPIHDTPHVMITRVGDDWIELWLNGTLLHEGHSVDIRCLWELRDAGVFVLTEDERPYVEYDDEP